MSTWFWYQIGFGMVGPAMLVYVHLRWQYRKSMGFDGLFLADEKQATGK